MKLPIINTDIQIRFADLDPLGHVSNNSYSQYFEVARLDWFSAIGIKRPMSVLANVNVDFLGEINIEDKIYVNTRCIKKGTKSLQLAHDIYANGLLVTKSTAVIVGFDQKTRKSCALLEGWEASAETEESSGE